MSKATAWNWFESCIVVFANVLKPRDMMASEISFMCSGTMCLMRCWRTGEVSTVLYTTDVEEIPFLSSETAQMRACIWANVVEV